MKASRWLWCMVVSGLALGAMMKHSCADDSLRLPVVSIIAVDPFAAEEGCAPATFLVVRDGTDSAPLTVRYKVGGTAENGTDYVGLDGLVTIPRGARSAPVVVTPIDDYDAEGTESVVVTLRLPPDFPPPYAIGWPGVAFAEIADNDAAPTNTPPDVIVVRPPDGAVLEGGDDIPIVAIAKDVDGRVATVEFFANGVSLGVVPNRMLAAATESLLAERDPLFEVDADKFPPLDASENSPAGAMGSRVFSLVWRGVPPGNYVLTAAATDDDGATAQSPPVRIEAIPPALLPVVSVRATDPVASEPRATNGMVDTATFFIHRSGPTHSPLTVYYRLGGTAENGADYAMLPHGVTIPAGQRGAEVVIVPLTDNLAEGAESVLLKLTPFMRSDVFPPPPDAYTVGLAHTARAVIRDAEPPSNLPPRVRLVKPLHGEIFRANSDIEISAVARDDDGFVADVEFFEGTNSLGIVTNRPSADPTVRGAFAMVWTNVPPGRYVLTATAADNEGAATPSGPVVIEVAPMVRPPLVDIVATDPVAAETAPTEPPNVAVFTVTRTGALHGPLVVYYLIDGSAENGVDYIRIPDRVQIPSGAASAHIVVKPIDDNLVDGCESVVLKIVPPPLAEAGLTSERFYRVGNSYMARAVIHDNDLPSLNHPPLVKVVHPEDGTIFRSPLDMKLAALARDPDGWVRTVEFFAGSVSLGVVSNHATSTVSPEQAFWLTWRNSPPGRHVLTAVATDNRGAVTRSPPVVVTVLSPICPPVVTIRATDPHAWEGSLTRALPDAGAGADVVPDVAVFTVAREGCVAEDLDVFYDIGGTAENGVDYERLSGRVTIAAGLARAEIVVKPIDDDIPEPTETVVLTVVPPACIDIYPPPPSCYRVGEPARAVAYIFDNDLNLAAELEIVQPASGDRFPAGSNIAIDLVAKDPDGWVAKVEFFVDRQKIGERSMLFVVPPPPGQPQKFSMIWTNAPPGDHMLHARATDNRGAMSHSDPVWIKVHTLSLPVVIVEAVDPIASEPAPLLPAIDPAVFRVSRYGGDTNRPLTVQYRLGGTASNGEDYEKLSGLVSIPADSRAADIVVIPLHDTLVEGAESVIVVLEQPPCDVADAAAEGCYVVGIPGRAIAYIRDNDSPNRPPAVSIVSPANGSTFAAPLDLRLLAAARDDDGWVMSVEFFDGSNSLGSVVNPVAILDSSPVRIGDIEGDVITDYSVTRPFVLVWTNVPPGKHALTAVATDNTGARTRSRPVEIAVRAPVAPPVVTVEAIDPIAHAGTGDTATFVVRRVGTTNGPLTVYCRMEGTARNGEHYKAVEDRVTIPDGRRAARVVIVPTADHAKECVRRTVLLGVRPSPLDPLAYEVGRPASAAAVIVGAACPSCATGESFSDGCLHFRLDASPGWPYRLEASADLSEWETLHSGVAPEEGVSVVVPEADVHSRRFFRIVPEYGDIGGDE